MYVYVCTCQRQLGAPVTDLLADRKASELSAPMLKGCVPAQPDELQGLPETPSIYYVQVDTAKFPGGAIRGQVSEAP
jgi:CHRD domain